MVLLFQLVVVWQAAQSFGDNSGGSMLLVSELGVAVEIAPKLEQLFALDGREH